MERLTIAGRAVGAGHPPWGIAKLGATRPGGAGPGAGDSVLSAHSGAAPRRRCVLSAEGYHVLFELLLGPRGGVARVSGSACLQGGLHGRESPAVAGRRG